MTTALSRPKISASQVERLLLCPAGATLPTVEERSIYSLAGTATHARLLRDSPLPSVRPRELPDALADWLGDEPRFEIAFAWEPPERRAIVLGENLGRAYPEPRGPIGVYGTADALAERGPRLYLADLKTGRQTLGGLPRPEESWQLRTLAVLWWLSRGTPPDAEVDFAWFLPVEPNSDEYRVEASRGLAEATDLAGWLLEIGLLAARVAAGGTRAAYARGPWCVRCSSFDFCEANREVLRRISPRELGDPARLPDDAVASAFSDLVAAEEVVERARAQLAREVARRGSVPTRPGRELVYEAGAGVRRVVDPERVAELAEEVLPGAGFAVKTTETTVAIGSVERVLGKEAISVLEAAEAEGAIERAIPAPTLKERRKRRGKVADA